jgi:hypothetical protein
MNIRQRIATVLLALTAALTLVLPALADNAIVNPYTLYTYDQMVTDVNALRDAYPELITVSSIGESVAGRELVSFTLGTGDRVILLCASMHAREYVSTNFLMNLAEGYARGWAEDAVYHGMSYRELLSQVTFYVVPMVNPDGVTLAQTGAADAGYAESVAAMPITDAKGSGLYGWKANLNGVDLNHNFPYLWSDNPDVTVPSSANYNGTAPCSEPETRALMELISTRQFYLLASFHTSGQCVYWIDSSNSQALYDKLKPVASRIAGGIGYTLCPVEDVSKFGGYLVNYARATYERPCFTVELCPYYGTYPYSSYQSLKKTLEKVYPIGLLMAQEAVSMEQLPPLVKVELLGEPVAFPDQGPVIADGRTLVPLRAVAESCGLTVDWNADTCTVVVADEETTVELTVDSPLIAVNGALSEMDCVPQIVSGRTMLPIRYVLEAFGYQVDWDGDTYTVRIEK